MFLFYVLKGEFAQKWNFIPLLLTTVSIVAFSNPGNRVGVSQRERIPPSANTMETYGGHALKRREKTT